MGAIGGTPAFGQGYKTPVGTISSDGTSQWNGTAWVPSPSSTAAQKQANQQPYDAAAQSPYAVNNANVSAAGDMNRYGVGYNIDPTGQVSYNTEGQQQRMTMDEQAKLDAQKRDSMMALLSSQSGGSAPHVGGGAVPFDENAARTAAFSRAKEQAGQIARSSLTSIAENLAGRNMTGGGLQALRESGAISGAGDQLQELNRDQLISDTNRASDVADRNYQGDITQRGQDLSNRASYLSLIRSLY